jgi:ketosteroid isomerase-like protein
MRDRVSLLLAAIALALLHVRCQPRAPEAELEAINTLQRQVDAAIIAGDTESYVALIAEDAVLMPPNAPPVIGKDAIRSWNQTISKQFRIEGYTPAASPSTTQANSSSFMNGKLMVRGESPGIFGIAALRHGELRPTGTRPPNKRMQLTAWPF